LTGLSAAALASLLMVGVGLVGVATIPATPTAAATIPGWSIVPGAATDAQNSNLLLGSTCTDAWDCWSVGLTIDGLNGNGQPVQLIEHWNGTAWVVANVTDPPGSQLTALWDVTCPSASNCWAVGAQKAAASPAPVTMAEHWNGADWSVVPTPATNGYLTSVTCASATDCWAAGTSVTDDNNSDPLHGFIDHWDGSVWSTSPTVPSGQAHDQFNAVACASSTDCWAVGFAGPNALDDNFLPNILPVVTGANAFVEHWDGTGWSVVAAPAAPAPSGTYLDAVTCVSSSRCWAVGATMGSDGQPAATLVDSWDGTTWSTVPSPDPSSTGSLLTDVTCLDAADCWASGAVGQSGGGQGLDVSPLIAEWDGSAWSVGSSPGVTAAGYLNSVSCAGTARCFATGFALTGFGNNSVVLQTLTEQLLRPPASHRTLWAAAEDGGVFAFGDAAFYGSLGNVHLNAPIVGVAATPDGGGYWLVAADGGVFAFGDADYEGSLGNVHLNAPIVGVAATPDGGGYWLVAADGGVFAFGDADYEGSVPGQGIVDRRSVRAIATTPDGQGYWLVGADGAVFAYGDATFIGSLAGLPLSGPVTAAAVAG
jgi:hypothetical protein